MHYLVEMKILIKLEFHGTDTDTDTDTTLGMRLSCNFVNAVSYTHLTLPTIYSV